jgi:hypothetical protein
MEKGSGQGDEVQTHWRSLPLMTQIGEFIRDAVRSAAIHRINFLGVVGLQA